MQILHALIPLFLWASFPLGLHGQAKTEKPSAKPLQAEFKRNIGLFGGELPGLWAGLPLEVSAPSFRETVFPSGTITFALLAEGRDREQLLRAAECSFAVEYRGITREFKDLRPVQVHEIKTEGQAFARFASKFTPKGSEAPGSTPQALALALFKAEWTVPDSAQDGIARVRGTVRMAGGGTIALEEATIRVQSFDTAVREGAFRDTQEMDAWMMTYYQHPEPSRLLHVFRAAKDNPTALSVNRRYFYAEALRSAPEAAMDLLERLRKEDASTRLYALSLLREAGYDTSFFLGTFPENEQRTLLQALQKIPVFPDPYDLGAVTGNSQDIPRRMDMLWCGFLATGQPRPVRAIANVLAWRDDWRAWQKAREEAAETGLQPDPLSPQAARAGAYVAAGWSLASFVRNHGLVADFVEAWKQDGSTAPIVREELRDLASNPAFSEGK